jgi:archaellum biogenesis ATPase FlaH
MSTIESAIVKGLLFDEDYARKVHPYLKEEYFDGATKGIFQTYTTIFEKYNKIPTMEAMLVAIQKSGMSEDVFSEACGVLEESYKSRAEMNDTQWLVDETEQYCSDKSLFDAIYKSINIIEGNDKELDKHSIPDMLNDALSVSFETTVGSDYLEDFKKRFDYYTNVDSRLSFPLNALQKLSNGGLPPKTLSCFLAATNVGKSALMCFLAGEWLKAGKNVLYITMEMSEEAVQERIDANLLDVTTDELKNPNLDYEWFSSKIAALRGKTVGRLMVKEYPTSSAHAGHFRHLLKEYKLKKKFKPDVVFIDYINICASSRYKSMSGVNSYSYIKAIAEELRGLAVEQEIPFITATQTNREAANSMAPDMTATSESFGLPMSLDFFVAIVSSQELMEMGRQAFILLKTRFGSKAGVKSQTVGIDYNHMRYSDIETDDNRQDKVTPDMVGQNKPLGLVEHKMQKVMNGGIPADISWD